LSAGLGETLILDEDWSAQVSGGSYAIQTTAALTNEVNWVGTDAYWSMAVASFKAGLFVSVSDSITVTDSPSSG